MKVYIKGDYTREIPFDYLELAKRAGFVVCGVSRTTN